MEKRGLICTFLLLLLNQTTLLAIVDVEKEINEPVAEMKMLDDAMNKGIKEQRERNARKPMIIEESVSFHELPMLEFVDQGDKYVLEKSVEDINNTEVKTKLENNSLTVTEIRKIEEVEIEDSVALGGNSRQSKYFESTISETLSLPANADAKSLTSEYKNGLLKVIVNKK